MLTLPIVPTEEARTHDARRERDGFVHRADASDVPGVASNSMGGGYRGSTPIALIRKDELRGRVMRREEVGRASNQATCARNGSSDALPAIAEERIQLRFAQVLFGGFGRPVRNGPFVMLSSGTLLIFGCMTPSRQRPGIDPTRIARTRRDDSVARITKVTKAVGIGVLATTGALGLYLGKALPGHQAATQGSSTSTSNGGSTQSSTGAASSGQLGPPSSPPTHSQQSAPVVSGAS